MILNFFESYGTNGIRAENMSNGIEKAIEIEKSKTNELFFIEIVADDIDYIPQLKILNKETNASILIITSDYNEDEHHRALNLGADFYGAFCKTPKQNINTVFAIICSIERRANKKKHERNEQRRHIEDGEIDGFIKSSKLAVTEFEQESP